MTSGGVWKPKLEFEISALVLKVSAELRGEVIEGFVSTTEGRYRPFPNLVEEFLNSPIDTGAILRFTKTYGPVPFRQHKPDHDRGLFQGLPTWRLWPEPEEDSKFNFTLDEWRESQRLLQWAWKARAGRKGQAASLGLWHEDELRFHRTADRIELRICNIARYLDVCLHALPAERMKQCKRSVQEGCPTPYFVATHLRQDYCGVDCAAWAQRAVKRKWWNERRKQHGQ